MVDMNALERQVAGEVNRVIGPARPVDDLAVYNAVSAASQSPKWRFQSMFSATKFVVAGAIVALFGSFLLSGVLTQPSEEPMPAVGVSAFASPDASATSRFRLPAVLPEDVESGVIETEAGEIRWVHVTGTSDSLPSFGRLVPWPTGIGYLEIPRDYGATPTRFWVSEDGIDWERGELPAAHVNVESFLVFEAGEYWLGTGGPDGRPMLWRSTDGEEWHEIDVTPLGTTFSGLGITPPTSSGELTIGVLNLGDDGRASRFYVVEDDVAEPVRVPWGTIGDGRLLAVGDQIYAYDDTDHSSVQVWRSPDGRAWEEIGTLPLPRNDDWAGLVRIAGAISWESFSGELLATEDGITWRSPPDRPNGRPWAHRHEPGWFTSDGGGDSPWEGDKWSVLIDDAWVRLDEIGIEHERTGGVRCAVSAGGIGDVAILTRADTCYPEDSTTGEIGLWLVSLEDIDMASRQLSGPPALVVSGDPKPSAAGSPAPEQATTTPDLLPGVGLVTEEVEPGVYRVVSDGVRDLATVTGGYPPVVVAGMDGSVYLKPDSTDECRADGQTCEVVRIGSEETLPIPLKKRWVWLEHIGGNGVPWIRTGNRGNGDPIGDLRVRDGSKWVRVQPRVVETAYAADGRVWLVAMTTDGRRMLIHRDGATETSEIRPRLAWLRASPDGSLVVLRQGEQVISLSDPEEPVVADLSDAPPELLHRSGGVKPPSLVRNDGTLEWGWHQDPVDGAGWVGWRLDGSGWSPITEPTHAAWSRGVDQVRTRRLRLAGLAMGLYSDGDLPLRWRALVGLPARYRHRQLRLHA